jgi:periplasmic mercuric ion binding protein
MRKLFASLGLVAVVGVLHAGGGDGKKGEIKGAHICCGQCVKVVKGILEKVDGLSDIAVDQKTKTATFTAKDKKTAEKAVAAMSEGGFAGTAKYDDKALSPPSAKASNSKVAEVTVKGVHSCCGQCRKAITALFEGSEVKFDGKGPQQDVTIKGKDLIPDAVLKKLNETGFNGTIGK